MKKFIRNNKAVTAVEFAIIAPVFFLIFMGIIEVGLTMFVDSTMNTALRSAARKGIPEGYASEQDFRNVMDDYMAGLYRTGPQGMDVISITIPPAAVDTSGNITLASANAELDALTRFSGAFSTDPVKFFADNARFESDKTRQSGAITIYAAKYKWGGFTQLVGAFLPDHLYAVSIVRNEVFEQ